jgi:uncharacterized protein (DUF849 family)
VAQERKVIVTCAITGAIHTPSMSPYLPVTPEEIAEAAIEAVDAGAAIVHLHARNPETGKPDQRPEAFQPILQLVKKRSDCIVNLTTGGAPYMKVEERVRPAALFKPELASLNMGSMNFGLFPMLSRYKDFRFDWERQHLENSRDLVFRNTYQDIEYVLSSCSENGTRFEFAMAAAMGGNVRVGLEDSLWDRHGQLAEKNATQVRRARQIIEGLGVGLATAQDARDVLQLKGKDRVSF